MKLSDYIHKIMNSYDKEDRDRIIDDYLITLDENMRKIQDIKRKHHKYLELARKIKCNLIKVQNNHQSHNC